MLYNDKEVILKENFLNLVYPVGSIYWSSKNTNPATLFGGTWTQIKDKFILAAGGSYAVNSTGGAATVTLSVSNMPSHKHSFTPSGTVGSHKHSFTPSGTVGSHTHTGPSHTHSFTPSGTVSSTFSGVASTGSAHVETSHNRDAASGVFSSTDLPDRSVGDDAGEYHDQYMLNFYMVPRGTVTSDFSGTAGNTDAAGTGNTGETAPSFTGTAGYTGETAPSFSGTAGTTSSSGSGSSFSILPPYVVKYCWERIA